MASKFALIIANTEYTDPGLAQLTAPGQDAKTFGQVLDSPDYGAFNDVIILLNENESKVSESIDYFFSLKKPDDLLLLYFSGHGVRDEYGSLYLAVKNTNRARLRSTAIKADFIREAMDQSRSKRQVIILDCCNSGAFAQGTKAETGGSMGTASAFQGTGFGRVVLTASDATQFAWEGDKIIGETENSLFTHFLVSGMKGEADLDGDGNITVDELYDYVYEQVIDLTPQQTPGKWSYKQHGEIVLRDNVRPREVRPAPLPTDMLELLSHGNASVRKAGVQDLVNLLEGKHLGLARAAEEKLREIAESDESLSLRKVASDALSTHGLSADQPASEETSKQKLSEIRPVVALTDRSAKLENAGTQQTAIPISVSESKEIAGRQRDVTSARPKTLWLLIAGVVGFIGLVCGGILIWGAIQPNGTDTATTASQSAQEKLIQAALTQTAAAQTPVPTVSTEPPTQTPIPPTPTSTPATPTLGIGSTMPGKDGMTLVYVPEGEFTMGSADYDDEKPIHTVYVDAFWVDQTEVTIRMYALCVQVGECKEPASKQSKTRSSYYGNAQFSNYPVILVNWYDAESYCSWVGRRLPTQAEWEKAARGENALVYPWGNYFDAGRVNFCDKNCPYERANQSYDDGFADTAPVGSYPDGISPYGALDMAGNVWEWVADWYDVYPGGDPSASSAFGQTYRVLRGGAWDARGDYVRSAGRGYYGPLGALNNLGFRCAMDATP